MSLKYVGLQIAQAREETGETDYSDTNGVPQSVPIQALREAVIHCQNSLYLAAPQIFDVIGYLTGVVNQIEYSLPENAYIGSAVASAEYSQSGQDNDYQRLSYSDYGYRLGGTGIPVRFIPYGDAKMLVDPACSGSGGLFRIVYGASLDEPELRRGKIKTVTKDGSATNYATIELENDANLDETTLGQNEYFCANDKDGVVKYYNVNYTAYDSTTKILTLNSATPVSGGSLTVGDYIACGRYATTHVKLNKIAEPIILAFLRRRFYLEKSSTDVQNEEDNIAAFTKEMVAAYKRRVRTAKKIPYAGRFENLGRGRV